MNLNDRKRRRYWSWNGFIILSFTSCHTKLRKHQKYILKTLDIANTHLFYNYDDYEHLPIPVYSDIKPSMGPKFILDTFLSLSIFSTDRELLLNNTQRGCFCNVKLIGEEDDPNSLHNYFNQVINIFVNNQLVFFQMVNV